MTDERPPEIEILLADQSTVADTLEIIRQRLANLQEEGLTTAQKSQVGRLWTDVAEHSERVAVQLDRLGVVSKELRSHGGGGVLPEIGEIEDI